MLRIVGLGLSISLFIASLGFKTLILSKGDSSFLPGWVCLLLGFEYLAWFANPLFMFGIVFLLLKRFSLALAASALSAILATTTFFIREAEYNEAGHTASVVGYGAGFYLWLSSISVLLLTSPLATLVTRKRLTTPPKDLIRRSKFQKSSQLFLRPHNEPLPVAMRVSNPDRSSLAIQG